MVGGGRTGCINSVVRVLGCQWCAVAATAVEVAHCQWARTAKAKAVLGEAPHCQWRAATAAAGGARP
jgi:hypothetical protein